MKDGKRGLRRHHKARMKRRARRIYPDWPGAVKKADNLKGCSCWMCGNPRRWLKGSDRLTVQERIADIIGTLPAFGVRAKSVQGDRERMGRQNNWNIIADHLAQQSAGRVDATFDEVNQWVGGGLPASAYTYQAWWSGERATWTADGWLATPNFEQRTVVFRRT